MDPMEIDDNIFINKSSTMYSLISRANSQQRKRPSRCVSVCVGLALVVLLAAVVGQAVYYEVFSRRLLGNPDNGLVDQLRGTNASLHDETKELQVHLRNLTEERELLLEHLNSEREACQHRLSALTAAAATMGRDLWELQANCSRLRATAERLHVDNADLQRQNVDLNASLETQKKSQAAAEAQSELSAARFRDRYESLQRDNERKELQVLRLRNLTEERELLLEHLNTERDARQHRLSTLTSERDLLSASYDESRREGGRLTAAAAAVGRDLMELQANCSRLRATAERLHVDNADLQRRNVNLNASLETQKKSLAAAEVRSVQSAARFRYRYESLQRDKEELNGSCQVLRREIQQLQRSYTVLAAARDDLRVQLENMKRVSCQPGWIKFNESCYFFATSSKNWESSRQYCKSKGGDLVVVNSQEEQAFINQAIQKGTHVWIGLSDILVERTWTWVDGTPLTLKFWYPGQPNSQGDQDCVELVQSASGEGLWNDEDCTTEQTWICEN
ncbi:uncharacterized protein LOC142902754 [Nelusetta ayraudi]|uniref:uncharacterized protein LOC142902754 n=1 Tax=Nelusetta ayraudi TaxID=303726 RepID=UPI003F7277DC